MSTVNWGRVIEETIRARGGDPNDLKQWQTVVQEALDKPPEFGQQRPTQRDLVALNSEIRRLGKMMGLEAEPAPLGPADGEPVSWWILYVFALDGRPVPANDLHGSLVKGPLPVMWRQQPHLDALSNTELAAILVGAASFSASQQLLKQEGLR